MSNTKHTPGPWTVTANEKGPGYHVSAFEASWAQMVTVHASPSRLDEANANASLIASAPDLLAALEAVLRFDQSEGIPGEYKHDVTLAMKVRAAINKATGTTSA